MKQLKLFLLGFALLIISVAIPSKPQAQAETSDVDGQITLALEAVEVVDLTGCPFDDDCWGNDDEPYFPEIAFRSRLYESGSTEVVLANELYEFASLDEGDYAIIPSEAGMVIFEDVHFSTLDSIAASGDFPEILGMVTIAMEHDESIDIIRNKINAELPKLEEALGAQIENGELVDLLIEKLSEPEPPTGEEGSTNEACEGFDQIIGQLPSGSFSTFDELFNLIFSEDFINEDFILVEIIDTLLLNPIADFFLDDLVDIHIFAYITVLDSEIDFEITCEQDGTAITISTWPTVPNSSPPQPASIQYAMDENPIVFKGDGGTWHVEASFTTTANETLVPQSNYTSEHPLLVKNLYLPLTVKNELDTTHILLIPPDDIPTREVSAITYNVQFLTPWDDGIIDGSHWPNTPERSSEIGAALACFPIVVLNETVNDNRRLEILGAMQANSRYCDDELPDSSFQWISGPEVNSAYEIEGWPSAIETFTSNIGEPIMGHEITIASRFPIVQSGEYIYQNRYGIDSLAAKGIMYARLQLGTNDLPSYIDVFATHLQAGYSEIRRAQILELADFIYEHSDHSTPILLLGDFNINGAPIAQSDNDSDYTYLTTVLSQLSNGHSLVDIGSHLTGGTNFSESADSNRSKRIDYIFTSNPSLISQEEDIQIIDFSGTSGQEGTLSDHAAVSAELQFPITQSVDGPDLIVNNIELSSEGVKITIENIGSEPVLPGEDFWLDVYIAPDFEPTEVNQIWQDVGEFGLVWGVRANDVQLEPGGTATLTLTDTHFDLSRSNIPAVILSDSKIFAQVDSVNSQTAYGGILESHEEAVGNYNNISVLTLSKDVSTNDWLTRTLALDVLVPTIITVRD